MERYFGAAPGQHNWNDTRSSVQVFQGPGYTPPAPGQPEYVLRLWRDIQYQGGYIDLGPNEQIPSRREADSPAIQKR